MALKVEKVVFWSGEIEDKPGALAKVLEHFAGAGVDLQVVLAERNPAKAGFGSVCLAPVRGKKAMEAAKSAGLSEATSFFVLRVEGPNKPGVGHLMTSALAEAGINLNLLSAAVLGKRFVVFLGFENESDLKKASKILKGLKA